MPEYDVIIVGAGSAGSALAARLSEDPARSVLVLEWGHVYAAQSAFPADILDARTMGATYAGNAANYQVPSSLSPTVQMPIPRGRILGGSSALNGAYFTRGIPENFDRWAQLGNDRWAYDEVLPFFRRLESDGDFPDSAVHGDGGPVPVTRGLDDPLHPVSEAFAGACRDLGFPEQVDKNAPGPLGIGPIPSNRIDDTRMNMGLCYLVPVLDRENLTVRGEAFVRRVVIEGGRAVGVEVEVEGRRETIRGGEVVLSAGSVKSPQLLMLSGIGPAADLRALGIDVVADVATGASFRDHMCMALTFTARETAPLPPGAALFQQSLSATTEGSDRIGDMEIYPLVLPMHELMPAPGSEGLYGSGADLIVVVALLQQPESAGRLRLVSTDPHDLPEVNYQYFSEASDVRRMRELVRTTVDLLEAPSFRAVLKERGAPGADVLRSDAALDAWMTTNMATGIHMTSSCHMGPASDPTAVVDQECRVRGVEGLRVVDASVMPDAVSHGPSATTTMIGERASAFH